MNKPLTAAAVKAIREPGKYRCGHGLYVFVSKTGNKSYVQRIVVGGKRREIGLGSCRLVTLAEARDAAIDNERAARRGDFLRPASVPTFGALAGKVDVSMLAAITREKRERTLARHAGGIMDRAIDRITRDHVLAILRPLNGSALGAKVRGYVSGVFALALAEGHVSSNIVDDIAGALPRKAHKTKHHDAIPYAELGGALAAVDAGSAGDKLKAALRFIALTACRQGEACGAQWNEIDLDARVWTVPAERMKARVEHRVPLSDAAVELLNGLPRDGVYVFGNGSALSPKSVAAAWKRHSDTTVHGLRSAFRTWASERTDYTRDVAEMALAHKVGSDVERSYARSTLFDKRAAMMQDWADFLSAR